MKTTSPESSIQERPNVFAWLVFHIIALWSWAGAMLRILRLRFKKHPCAWCQMEAAVKAQPHYSHGICERHKQEELAKIKRFPKSQHA